MSQKEIAVSNIRKQFERHYLARLPGSADRLTSWSEILGRYVYDDVQVRWETWQACFANEVVQQSVKAAVDASVQKFTNDLLYGEGNLPPAGVDRKALEALRDRWAAYSALMSSYGPENADSVRGWQACSRDLDRLLGEGS